MSQIEESATTTQTSNEASSATAESTNYLDAAPKFERSPVADSAYRRIEKKYKIHYIEQYKTKNKKMVKKIKLAPPPSYEDVIDFRNVEHNTPANKSRIIKVNMADMISSGENKRWIEQSLAEYKSIFEKTHEHMKLPEVESWNVYTLSGYPGFYFISDLITPVQQRFWVKQCLEEYPQPPNITNLNIHYGELRDIWKNYLVEKEKQGSTKGDKKKQKQQQNTATATTSAPAVKLPDPIKLLDKMTWCTLGYQYLWTQRKYVKELKVEFPRDIGSLVTLIAAAVGYGPYEPEAAICNFYSPEQTMGGHKDDAEYELTKPIVSMSFGNQCIFLLGGDHKDVEPLPIFIRSGDIMIMGGSARTAFHGVARIMHETIPTYLQPDNVPEDFKPHSQYLCSNRRINLNVRQVWPRE